MMDGLFALWHSVTKRGSTLGTLEYFVGFLFSGGVYLFLVGACGVLCLKLTLNLCIFSSYLVFDGIFLLGGVLCLIGTLFVSCFKMLIDLYL